MEWYVSPEVNNDALTHFFEIMKQQDCEIHTLQIYKGGKKLLRVAQEPYSCTDPREIYSLSKTFTSTVTGIAFAQGLLKAEDRVADILGIQGISERFAGMTLENALSMNTGHGQDAIMRMGGAEDAVEGFYSVEPEFVPGTHFTYNSGATCLIAAVVEKVTGMTFFDYACKNLFYPLGITNIFWDKVADGHCLGAAGLHISSDDIVKLGLMYAQGGVYGGRRYLPEDWFRRATSRVSDNSTNGTPDWQSGYGYQIWLNARDGFRGDGAFGQLCMILPKHDMVIVVQGSVSDMQKEVDGIFDLADHVLGGAGEAKAFAFPVLKAEEDLGQRDEIYQMDENPAGFRTVHLVTKGDRLELSFSDGFALQTVEASVGSWTENRVLVRNMTPSLLARIPSPEPKRVHMAACCSRKDGSIRMMVRYRSNPHTELVELRTEGEKLSMQIRVVQFPDMRPEEWRVMTGTRV